HDALNEPDAPMTSHRARRNRFRRVARDVAVSVLATVLLASCSGGSPSVLSPDGPSADRVAGLWWLMFSIAMVVLLIVLGFMLVAVLRRRATTEVERSEPAWGTRFVVISGVVIPFIVLTSVFAISIRDTQAIE